MERIRFVEAGSLLKVELGTKATAVLILGAILCSGYSHAARARAGSVPQTVGIVTQIEGLVYVLDSELNFDKPGAMVSELKAGDVLTTGSRVWVDEGASLAVVNGRGGAFLTQGPAVLEVGGKGELQTIQGTFRVVNVRAAAAGGDCGFEIRTPYAAACAGREMAAWVSPEYAQFVAVRGAASVWHPALKSASALALMPGWFTESSPKFRFVQPRRARMVATENGTEFLAKLGALWDPEVSQMAGAALLAAQENPQAEPLRGSRTMVDVKEKANAELLEKFNERVFAKSNGDADREVYSALETAGKRQPGRAIASAMDAAVEQPVQKKEKKFSPKVEVREQGRTMDEEQRTLLENLKESVPRF